MRLAVVGSGGSGLYTAYLLKKRGFAVTVFEKSERVGGNICPIEINGCWLDLGFQVFNPVHYPKVTSLFHELGLSVQKTDMSFGIEIQQEDVNFFWGSSWLSILRSLACNKPFRTSLNFFGNLVKEIINWRFFGKSYVTSLCVKKFFVDPIGQTLWSTLPEQTPSAEYIISFLKNHGLINLMLPFKWYVLRDSSKRYLDKITSLIEPENIKCHHEVRRLVKTNSRILIEGAGFSTEFDAVFLAVDPENLFRLLIQSNFRIGFAIKNINSPKSTNNRVIVHNDCSVLPKIRGAWNFMANSSRESYITYDLLKLQKKNFLVSLNPPERVSNMIFKTHLVHPVPDQNLKTFVELLKNHQGSENLFFCGAYFGNCFHEDAFESAEKAVSDFLCLIQNKST
ncbi:MAG: FAD-dependent oxidoreductase [Deltaproteobacteria bacterium]|nr:FAD-dependent oxidoreductase [Deltaproteobacteria bacterium]